MADEQLIGVAFSSPYEFTATVRIGKEQITFNVDTRVNGELMQDTHNFRYALHQEARRRKQKVKAVKS
jgi:hypothetical protein